MKYTNNSSMKTYSAFRWRELHANRCKFAKTDIYKLSLIKMLWTLDLGCFFDQPLLLCANGIFFSKIIIVFMEL